MVLVALSVSSAGVKTHFSSWNSIDRDFRRENSIFFYFSIIFSFFASNFSLLSFHFANEKMWGETILKAIWHDTIIPHKWNLDWRNIRPWRCHNQRNEWANDRRTKIIIIEKKIDEEEESRQPNQKRRNMIARDYYFHSKLNFRPDDRRHSDSVESTNSSM